MIVTKEIKNIKPNVSAYSLVGLYIDKFPLSFGNYFQLQNPQNNEKYNIDKDYYVTNMWYENFKKIVDDLKLKEVEVEIYQQNDINIPSRPFCFITDKRIPKSWWIQDSPCTTGCTFCSKEMHEFIDNKYKELYELHN